MSSQHSAKTTLKNEVFLQPYVVKMYYFAIDFEAEMLYSLAPPQGWNEQLGL